MKKKLIKKSKKRKGFTLIELLAVILILGIIALIAIPTVNSVVEQARKGAYENTVESVVKAIEEYSMMQELSGEKPLNGVYSMNELKDKLDLKGDYDIDGYVELSNGQIVNYSFSNDKYVVMGDSDGKDTITKSDLEISLMNKTYPYKENYKDRIVNAFITFGKVPSYVDSDHKWKMSSDGKINAYVVNNKEDSSLYDLYIVSENIIKAQSVVEFFYSFPELVKVQIDNIDTSECTDFYRSFGGNPKLAYINAEVFDFSNANSISAMFVNDKSLEYIDVSNWKLPKLTNTNSAFSNCTSLKKLDLSNWNVVHLYSIASMFNSCSSLEYIDVSKLDVSGVTDLSWIFNNCNSLKEIKGLENWNTAKATNFNGIFNFAILLTSLDVSSFNTSNGKKFKQTFAGLKGLQTLDISNIDMRNAETVEMMFYGNDTLKTIYVGDNWQLPLVTNDDRMFYVCKNLKGAVAFDSNKIDSSMANWDTGYLTKK